MINQELKEAIDRKIQNDEFDVTDLPAYFTLFCQLANEIEEIQEEVAGWNQRIFLDLAGLGPYQILVEDGRFTATPRPIDDPDLIFTMAAADAVGIFSGEKDAESAFVSGALKVTGDLFDAMKLQTLIEIVADEIEY